MSDLILIKIGGGGNINWDYIAEDLKNIIKKSKVIIVHGANAKRDEIAKKMGHPTKFLISPSGIESVLTEEKALEIFLMVYAGLVNKQVVAKFQSFGISAVGLSGVDGRLWEGKRKRSILVKAGNKTKLITDSLTGRVEKINTKLIKLLVDENYLPVICPPAISIESEIINADGDRATAVMAKELKVNEMIFLFEARGLMKNLENSKTLIKKIRKEEIEHFMKYAQGRMKKKLIASKYALENGMKKIFFGDGRIKKPISSALKGRGTIIS